MANPIAHSSSDVSADIGPDILADIGPDVLADAVGQRDAACGVPGV